MDFRSDNIGIAAPEIIASITEANFGNAAPYGDDIFSRHLKERFSEIFEREVDVFTAITGTAANSLAISTFCDLTVQQRITKPLSLISFILLFFKPFQF